MRQWLKNVAIAVDQLVNALAGGSPRETVSLRLSRSDCVLCRWICLVLERIDTDHCRRQHEIVGDVPRVPPESRAFQTRED